MKKILALVLILSMALVMMAGCTTTTPDAATGDASNDYAMINKIKVDYLLKNFRGFDTYGQQISINPVEKSPSEVTVAAQVKIIDELITQGVKAISINANGETGYDEVLKKAREAGVVINSFDSPLGVENRSVHVNQASTESVGAYMARLGVLAALQIDYPGDDMVTTLEKALAEYDGEELVVGCLSAGVDAPVQNGWLEAMKVELAKDMYKGKVNPEMDVKYGNDDLTESTTQAQAFLAEDKVDTIVSISSVALAAACQVYKESNSTVKMTGCGAPSEIQGFMPKADEDTFSAVCPYIVLWDLGRVGAVAACALEAEVNGEFDGTLGSTLEMDAWESYEAITFTVTQAPDGGTEIVIGDPLVFDKNNVLDWVDTL